MRCEDVSEGVFGNIREGARKVCSRVRPCFLGGQCPVMQRRLWEKRPLGAHCHGFRLRLAHDLTEAPVPGDWCSVRGKPN